MKALFTTILAAVALISTTTASAQQDKSKRPSPPMVVEQKLDNGYNVKVDYSAPSLKGRTIGVDVEPMKGKVWRMGANEATLLTVDHDFSINGKNLAAGTYSLFGLWNEDNSYTLIVNSATGFSGARYDQYKDKDILRTSATIRMGEPATEQLTYTVEKNGKLTLKWGLYNASVTIAKPV